MSRTLIALVVAVSAAATAAAGDFVKADPSRAIADCYIVVLKPGAAVPAGSGQPGLTVSQHAVAAAARYGGSARYFYEVALSGFSICLPEKAAQASRTIRTSTWSNRIRRSRRW